MTYKRVLRFFVLLACAGTLGWASTGCNRDGHPAPDAAAAEAPADGDLIAGVPGGQNDPAVHVDDAVITRGEIEIALTQMMAMWGGQVPPEEMERVQAQLVPSIVDQLVQRQLLINAVETVGVVITPEEIRDALREIEESLPEGMTLEDALAQQGMTTADLEEGIGTDLRINKLIEQRVAGVASVTEEEARTYYDENPDEFTVPETARARHVLVSFKDGDSEERRDALRVRAERIRQSIIDGSDFAEMAEEHSDCPSKERGGDLGRFERGQMVPAFEEAAFTHPLNEIGPLVETRFGYHILEITERAEPGTLAYDEVKDQLANSMEQERKQETVMSYLQELREQADIRYEDESLAPNPNPNPAASAPHTCTSQTCTH